MPARGAQQAARTREMGSPSPSPRGQVFPSPYYPKRGWGLGRGDGVERGDKKRKAARRKQTKQNKQTSNKQKIGEPGQVNFCHNCCCCFFFLFFEILLIEELPHPRKLPFVHQNPTPRRTTTWAAPIESHTLNSVYSVVRRPNLPSVCCDSEGLGCQVGRAVELENTRNKKQKRKTQEFFSFFSCFFSFNVLIRRRRAPSRSKCGLDIDSTPWPMGFTANNSN